jgi:GWxTD domain-containing protein
VNVPAAARRVFVLTFVCLLLAGIPLTAQDSAKPDAVPTSKQEDPLQRPLPKRKSSPRKTENAYKRWLDEEVPYIITDAERDAFKKLTNDQERASFVEHFWDIRNPNPDSEQNEYKDEYERRRAYANEHFAAGMPGWKTDRGRMYILHGNPDSIESHPAGGPYMRPAEEGGGETVTYPFEVWRYRHLDGIGQEIEFEFVDPCGCGEYRLTIDRGEKDAGAKIPGVGLTDKEAWGMANKADRGRNGVETLGSSFFPSRPSDEFVRIMRAAQIFTPPPVPERVNKEEVDVRIRVNPLMFDVRVDFAKGDARTALVPITIQVGNRELMYVGKAGMQHAALELYGRLTTLSGHVAGTFDEPLRLEVPAELLEKFVGNVSLYQEALSLRPGRYRLDIVLKDANSGKVGVFSRSITVPDFTADDKLAASTLVLADLMEPLSVHDIGGGRFVLGDQRVRPRVPPGNGAPATFARGQKVNLWMQAYNLALDETTRRPSATVEYHVVNTATGAPVLDLSQSTEQMGSVGNQLTLRQSLPPDNLAPGVYEVTIKVNDLVAKQSIAPAVKFEVK